MKIALSDLQKRFDVPTYTLRNWRKDEGWRKKLFNHMVNIYVSEQLKEIQEDGRNL